MPNALNAEFQARFDTEVPDLSKGYDHLTVRDGGMASQEFLRVHFGSVPDDERERVRRQLEECRALDTMGMVRIVDALHSACQTP